MVKAAMRSPISCTSTDHVRAISSFTAMSPFSGCSAVEGDSGTESQLLSRHPPEETGSITASSHHTGAPAHDELQQLPSLLRAAENAMSWATLILALLPAFAEPQVGAYPKAELLIEAAELQKSEPSKVRLLDTR